MSEKKSAARRPALAYVLKWPGDGDYLVRGGVYDPRWSWPEWSPDRAKARRFDTAREAYAAARTWGDVQPVVMRLVRKVARACAECGEPARGTWVGDSFCAAHMRIALDAEDLHGPPVAPEANRR